MFPENSRSENEVKTHSAHHPPASIYAAGFRGKVSAETLRARREAGDCGQSFFKGSPEALQSSAVTSRKDCIEGCS